MKPTRATTFVGFVHPGKVSTEFMIAMMNLRDVVIHEALTGPLISRARNLLLERFLESECGSFLSVDTDIAFRPEDLETLQQARKPIVGGLYYGILGHDPSTVFPVALQKDPSGKLAPIGMGDLPGQLAPVDAVGMGFTLIQREVVEALKPDATQYWPFAEAVIDGYYHGEDVVFCRRAADLGFGTWLEPKARVGHEKVVTL